MIDILALDGVPGLGHQFEIRLLLCRRGGTTHGPDPPHGNSQKQCERNPESQLSFFAGTAIHHVHSTTPWLFRSPERMESGKVPTGLDFPTSSNGVPGTGMDSASRGPSLFFDYASPKDSGMARFRFCLTITQDKIGEHL
jgi:hypothetical protein